MKTPFIFLCAAIFFLAGCAGAMQEPQAPTQLQAQAGATFSGPIQIGANYASSATLSFRVSEDGTSITNLSVEFKDYNCFLMSAEALTINSVEIFPIGSDISWSSTNIGQITGSFDTPTTASGRIVLNPSVPASDNSTITCNLGNWSWNAKAE